jgi:hypothetical protein
MSVMSSERRVEMAEVGVLGDNNKEGVDSEE